MADDQLSKPFEKSAMTEAEKRDMKKILRNKWLCLFSCYS